MLTKKVFPLALSIFCLMPLHSMNELAKREKFALLQQYINSDKPHMGPRILPEHATVLPDHYKEKKMDLIDTFIIGKEEVALEEKKQEQLSYFKLGKQYTLQALGYVSGSVSKLNPLSWSFFKKNVTEKITPNDWNNPLPVFIDGTWMFEFSSSYKDQHYTFCHGDHSGKIYNINTRKLMKTHPAQDGEDLRIPFISPDGTCSGLTVFKGDQRKMYLYNVNSTEKPKEILYQRAFFMGTKDGGMHAIVRKTTELDVYDVKNGTERTINASGEITYVSALGGMYLVSRSGYVLIVTKDRVFIHDIENDYARTEITYEKSFEIVNPNRDHLMPEGHFLAMVDGNICIYKAPEKTPIFKREFKGSINEANLFGAPLSFATLYDDKNKTVYFCNIETQKMPRVNVKNSMEYMWFSQDGKYLRAQEKSSDKKLRLFFYDVPNCKEIFKTIIDPENGGMQTWLPGPWYVYAEPKMLHLLDVKNGTIKTISHSGSMAWSWKIRGLDQSFAVRSNDQKQALVGRIENEKLELTLINSPDKGEFDQESDFNGACTVFGAHTRQHAYLFDSIKGTMLKELQHDSENPVIGWKFNRLDDVCALVRKKSIEIFDKNFELIHTLKFDSPVGMARFDYHGKLFKVVTQEAMLYYIITTQGLELIK